MRRRFYYLALGCVLAALLAGCKPKISFDVSNTEGAPPLKIAFTGHAQTVLLGFIDFSTIFPVKSQLWDFGDGGDISEDLAATHTYNDVGKYTVTFAATNLFGTATLTRPDLITVTGSGPAAMFQASPSTGNAPLAVTFTDTSTAGSKPIAAWVWDFGDGTSSTSQNPSHTFTTTLPAGQTQTFTVRLTVSNSIGENAHSTPISVTSVGPVANFSADPVQGGAPLAVTFTDTTTAGSSTIASWEWDFGDGGTSTLQHPSHVYESDGAFSVRLKVTTAVGTSEVTRENYITVTAGAPIARFRATDTQGLGPFDTAFKDLSVPGRYEITAYAWDFGDGGHSAAQHPLHTYQTPGTYTVSLTVTSEAGSSTETKTAFIQAYATPQAAMSVVAMATTGQYTFSDTSNLGGATLVSRLWDFGDGNTHAIASPVHTYQSPGTYTVTLTVTVDVGEAEPYISTTTQEITFSK